MKLFKKLMGVAMIGVVGTCLICGCGKKDEAPGAPEVEAAIEDIADIDASKFVELGDYKNLSATVLKKEEITEDVVNSYMDYIAGANSNVAEKPAGEAAILGDTANIDFEGKKDGVAFDGGTAQGYDLVLGSGSFISGFEEGIVGMKKGETKDLNLRFPDPYTNPDLAGQEVVFTVKLNSLTRNKPAELNDAFVQTLNIEGVKTVDQYRKYTKESLETNSQKMYDQRLEEAILDSLLSSSTIKETPSWLVDHYNSAREYRQNVYAEMAGMSLEDYVANFFGSSMEDYRDNIRSLARDDANILLLVKAVAESEGITITEDDIEALVKTDMEAGNFTSREEMMKATGFAKIDYEASAIKKKVIDILKSNASIEEIASYDFETSEP